MIDTTGSAPPAPPKKRSFFKKAAWQTQVKAEGEKEQDIFSHSHEFKDIVAERTKRNLEEKRIKEEEKRAKDEEKKRKADDGRARKKRRISTESEDMKLHDSGTSSGRASRKESKARSRTPRSPLPTDTSANSLSARYDALLKPCKSASPRPINISDIMDLGDSDTDPDDSSYAEPKVMAPRPTKPAPADDLEEVEDPALAALAAQARATAAKGYEVIVECFIDPEIPGTAALVIKTRANSTLERIKEAWCDRQGYSADQKRNVFLTWKNKKLFDTTTVMRCGLDIDEKGIVSVEGTSDIYDAENLPKIHLQAWTEELYKQWEKDQAAGAAAKKKAAESPEPVEPELEPEPESEARIRLVLKAKGKENFGLNVYKDTTFELVTTAYKKARAVPDDQPITLTFDGERLRTMDTVGDIEIDDLDVIEVNFR